ncbi:hypothetical protein ACFW1M_01305 [Streptomyces inhibens]|uniref:hypothetical protein n=1 Tax=Streptomyces inhibens TaxID=2293571 RepID=UPI0036980E7B
MRRTTTVASASAAVLCLGALLTGCGSAAETGYVAVGAAGPADRRAPTKAVPPQDGVELTPLDGDGDREARGDDGGGSGGRTTPGRPGSGPVTPQSPAGSGESAAPPGPSAPPTGAGEDRPTKPTKPNSPSRPGTSTPPHDSPGPPGSPSPEPPSPTIPAGPDAPAGLLVGKPGLADTDVRWCEKVTLDFLNTGDHPVTAGTVTFGTHIIGALGTDWATITSPHKLPLPLAPGEKKTGTWRVCVDAWRVPLGMHIDTRDVTFTWN